MYIKRHIEPVVSRIAKRKPVLVLTGARQVGKSTMLREVYHDVNYVALNRPLIRESARDNPSLFFEVYKPPIIVDEIQKAAELFDYIKDIVDENKIKGQFYLTGSQSLKLMKNVSDSLAGRAGVIKLMGLSLREKRGILYRDPFLLTENHLHEMDNIPPMTVLFLLYTKAHSRNCMKQTAICTTGQIFTAHTCKPILKKISKMS